MTERAELEALADEIEAGRVIHEYPAETLRQAASALRRLAAQDQKPVALAHVRLEDDGLFADLEVLDGTNLQPSMSPVALYLSPPPAAGWDGTQIQSVIERALLEDEDFATRAAYQNIRQTIALASAKSIVEALRHNAPPNSGAGKSGPIWFNGCDKTVPKALRYLADHDRPIGGEAQFNAAHLYQLADEIERTASRVSDCDKQGEAKCPECGGSGSIEIDDGHFIKCKCAAAIRSARDGGAS